jgi:chaperonin GroES
MLKLDGKIPLTEKNILAPNLTHLLSEADLDSLGEHIWEGYNQDKGSRIKWEKRTEAALNLAMQIVEGKSFPWAGCANVAFPLVTIAALQFHSRAYPAILPSPDVVQYRVVGEDPDGSATARATRVGTHMSWQLLEEDTAWEEQHDRLLITIPIVGCAFKKTYFASSKGHPTSELVLAHDLVLDYFAKSVEACARKTHIIPLYRNEVYENVKNGLFRDILQDDWYQAPARTLHDVHEAKENKRTGMNQPQATDATPFTFLEQHCSLDLDQDGYQEPYIATIELATHKIVRLVLRVDRMSDITRDIHKDVVTIRATEYFTKYGFIPSPDGSVYDIGFGVLLGPLNEATNSIVNQLLDAGTMSNAGGGFLGRGAKIRGGAYTFSPLEWKRVDSTGDDLRKNIVPLETKEPSMVLFQLLSLLINYTGRISGSTETMVGENPGQNTPAQTTQTMVEQGSKVYAAIFKRVWRSMKEEYKKWYICNAIHMPIRQAYGSVGSGLVATRDDYMGDPSRIAPVADPNITSDSMLMQQASLVADRASRVLGYNKDLVETNFLRAMKVSNIAAIYPGTKGMTPPKDPKVQIEEMKQQVHMARLQFEKMSFIMTLQEEMKMNQAKIMELNAKAALEMESAGGIKTGHQIAAFEAAIGAMRAHNENLHKHIELTLKGMENESARQNDSGGAVQGMAGTPSDQTAPGLPSPTGE